MTEAKKISETKKQTFFFPTLNIAIEGETQKVATLLANKKYKEAQKQQEQLKYDVDNDGDFDQDDISKLGQGLKKSTKFIKN